MSELDYDKIAKVLGGTVTEIAPTTFGPMDAAGLPKPCQTCGMLPDPLARLAMEVAEKANEYRKAKMTLEGDEINSAYRLDAAIDAYLAARSSPTAASREAGLDRLAREVAEAGIVAHDAGAKYEAAHKKMVERLQAMRPIQMIAGGSGEFKGDHEVVRLFEEKAKAWRLFDSALAAYRAAKERTVGT